jgi:hypothetical protein
MRSVIGRFARSGNLVVQSKFTLYFMNLQSMIIDESMQNAIVGGLAIVITLGAMLMMFSNVWTTKK